MKIAVIGTGYVGLSNAVLLSQNHEVVTLDIVKEKVDMINQKKSPIVDSEIFDYLMNKPLKLKATLNKEDAYKDSSFIIIATPTNYDSKLNFFDTTTVDNILLDISKYNSEAITIIKSTIPVGYTARQREKYPNLKIIFSPEFLREGKALYDNLYPSRIVVGDHSSDARDFANLLIEGAIKEDIPVLFTNSTEAEAIKLFSNTFLAMRVAYFNELDTYSEIRGLNSKEIIKGVCLDPRIGSHYNNPSFGYGGYCLPKDTKQLLANYKDIPQNIMSAIVDSNRTRKNHIAEMIISRNPKKVGIYRLVMKNGSDNIRESSIQGVMEKVLKEKIKVVVYEPFLKEDNFHGAEIIKNLDHFLNISDVIVTNRYHTDLDIVKDKVYTRDLFNKD